MVDDGGYHATETKMEAHLHHHQDHGKYDTDQSGDKNAGDPERDSRGSGSFPNMGDRDDPAAMSTLTTTGMTRRRSLP